MVDPYVAMACDGDIHPGMRGFLSKRVITLGEAVEIYEKELAKNERKQAPWSALA